jgi:hypothetical protein
MRKIPHGMIDVQDGAGVNNRPISLAWVPTFL